MTSFSSFSVVIYFEWKTFNSICRFFPPVICNSKLHSQVSFCVTFVDNLPAFSVVFDPIDQVQTTLTQEFSNMNLLELCRILCLDFQISSKNVKNCFKIYSQNNNLKQMTFTQRTSTAFHF